MSRTSDGGLPLQPVAGPAHRLGSISEVNPCRREAWHGQFVLAVATWIVLCLLHWDNDGLWYPQDAPRHLINGIFLRDHLAAGLPPPIDYARSYFIRYPIIVPDKYPPGFYFLEAATFSAVGPSPWAAKSLVLGFALFASLYQVAWLRRFVDREAGYLGALLPILPCIVQYSHAILLNVPAFALQLAALYHCRSWLDGGRRNQLYLAAAFGVAAVFVYQGALVLVLILGTWLALTGRWHVLFNRRALIAAVVILPIPTLLICWSLTTSGQFRWLFDSPYLRYSVTWLWYPRKMAGAFGPFLLAGSVAGALAGALSARWRAELRFSGGWVAVTYLFHTYLFGKDIRYILPLSTPLLSLSAAALWWTLGSLSNRLGPRVARTARSVAIATLLAFHLWLARSVVLPRADGFEAIVTAIRADEGPDGGSILGALRAIDLTLFTCFVRLDDPEFRLRVLPASWLWDFAGVVPGSDPGASGPIATGSIESSLAHSGCRWIVAQVDAEPGSSSPRPSDWRLREVLRLPRFELVGTFSIRRESPSTAALYRQVGPIQGLSTLARRAGSGNDDLKWLLRDPITIAR